MQQLHQKKFLKDKLFEKNVKEGKGKKDKEEEEKEEENKERGKEIMISFIIAGHEEEKTWEGRID